MDIYKPTKHREGIQMAQTEFQNAKEWFLQDLNCKNKAEGTIKAYKADLNNLERRSR